MIMSIKKGDVVYLKSGGPAMVVGDAKTGKVRCAWIDDHGNVNKQWFDVVCLAHKNPKETV